MSHIDYGQPEHAGWKEYKRLLREVGRIFIGVALVAASLSTIFYYLDSAGIEQIVHRTISPVWTCLLLWLPLVIQLIVFSRLRRKIKEAVSDNKLRAYYKFYFWRMAFSLATYTFLWCCYVGAFALNCGSRTILVLSWFPLGFIVLLLGIIVHATYLITKTPFHDDEYLLTEGEVRERYSYICLGLKTGNTSATETIREWLRKDRDCKIHRVTLKKEVGDLDVGHLREALNRLICNTAFYEATNPDSDSSSNQMLPNEVESKNREYLDKNLLNKSRRRVEKSEKQKTKLRRNHERLVKQQEQKDGIAMFPFYTMLFFFSIFVCIAYLFSFAFAFEDRYVQKLDRQGPVALFMSDDLFEDVGQYSHPTPSPTPRAYQLVDRQKVFYFDSAVAGITTEVARDEPDIRLRHIARINNRSLDSLSESVKAMLPNGSIRILLVGRADDNRPSKIAYSSNYEISAARVKSVRYLLQERLIAEQVPLKALASIEWIESPFSNDPTLAPKERQGAELSKERLILNNENMQGSKSSQTVPKEFTNNLSNEIFNNGNKDWKVDLRDFLGRLKTLSQKSVALESMQKILDDIHMWDTYKMNGRAEMADKLGDDIDSELYAIEDPSGRRRAVEVYFYEAHPPQADAQSQSTPRPSPKRMALLDYLYFAMYTITTTGYGDIKPMTPYAKFLCALANMTEFFFIVVFFNTLLSLRRSID
jgi:hypothetical protein